MSITDERIEQLQVEIALDLIELAPVIEELRRFSESSGMDVEP